MQTDVNDRRDSERHQCDYAASWSFFNKEGTAEGQILNVSQTGCYLRLDRPIPPGTTVMMRVLECRGAACDQQGPHMNTVAEVKWCCRIQNGSKPCYGSGLRYHYPV